MKLSNYLSGILSHFEDSRVVKNVKELVENIIEHKTIRLWTIAQDRAEFERSRRLVDGSLKSVLDEKKTQEATRTQGVEALGKEKRVVLLHDPCDIRKEESEKLENLGKVRDLDGKIVNGYSTFNTVGMDEVGKNVYPLETTVYSNGDAHYVRVKELEAYEQGKVEVMTAERVQEIQQFIEEESHINLPRVTYAQLERISQAFKAQNPTIRLCHVLDRQFDGVHYFKWIDQELEDEFVIRAKVSRNANPTDGADSAVASGDLETGSTAVSKLKDAEFAQGHSSTVAKLTVRKKVYQDVRCLIEWDTFSIDAQDYNVVRITLSDRQGNPLFKQPMLLVTNLPVASASQARSIYTLYLLRAKIEAVFKFIKDVLGWEDFQVQDYFSIRNILSLAFFVAGYFYHIGSALTLNPTICLIAQLGGGKGTVSRYFFLKGLQKLLIHASVERFIQDLDPSDDSFSLMTDFIT